MKEGQVFHSRDPIDSAGVLGYETFTLLTFKESQIREWHIGQHLSSVDKSVSITTSLTGN